MRHRFSQWAGRNPLAMLALVGIAAIAAADACELGASASLIAAAAGWLLLTASWPRPWLLIGAVALVFAGLHAFRLGETRTHPLRQRLLATPEQSMPVVLRGQLLPLTRGAGLDARRVACETCAIQWPGGGSQPLRARVRLALPPNFELVQPGLYEIHAQLTLPRPPLNPGQFDGAEYAVRMGWAAEGRAADIRRLEAAAWAPRFHLLQAAETCRQWIIRQLSRDLEDDPRMAAVIMAMALGASEAAGDEIEDAFRNSGTLHVFAVSGLHVSLVAAIGWLLLSLLTLRRSLAVVLLIAMVFGYAFVTGWRPSAARAALMVALLLGASLIQRRSSLQNSLGAAALVLLAADTHQLFQPGFQLSFGVLWAISLGVNPLMIRANRWCRLDPFLPQPLVSPPQRAWAGLRLWGASLAAVSIAAWVGGVPLMLGHFQSVTPIALIANCFLVPLSFLCIGATCLSLAFASIGFAGAQVLMNNTNWLLAKTMVAAAAFFADAPLANFYLNPRQPPDASPVEFQILHLPDGGSASHLRAGTRHWLVDTGNERNWRAVVRPWLRRVSVNHLDGVVVTHADVNHAGAVAAAAGELSPVWICTSQHEPWPADPSFATLRKLHARAGELGLRWRRAGIDETIELGEPGAGAAATVLYPGAGDRWDRADDRGLVLMLQLNGLRVLWLADAGFVTEKTLLARAAKVECDILVRSPHAFDHSGLTEFLLAAQPQALVEISDRRQAPKSLPDRVRDYCAGHACALFDLEVCGSVTIRFDRGGARLQGFANGQSAAVTAREPGQGRRIE